MDTHVRGGWVVVLLAALILVATVIPATAEFEASLRLVKTTYSTSTNRVTYSYELVVSDPDARVAGETMLYMRDMGGVLSQGDALFWRNAGFTTATARWLFNQENPFPVSRYFDIIADASTTKTDLVNYEFDGAQSDSDTVLGPVPLQTYTVSGTVFVDANSDGEWASDTEDRLDEVAVNLVDGLGTVVATSTSSLTPIMNGGSYVGNYVFEDVVAGRYTVVAPATAGASDALAITTAAEQTVHVVDASVTGVDFGYCDPASTGTAPIQAYVYFDVNHNGVMDDQDMRLPGVSVTLRPASGGEVTLQTDGDGFADFGNWDYGYYWIGLTDGGYGPVSYTHLTLPTN